MSSLKTDRHGPFSGLALQRSGGKRVLGRDVCETAECESTVLIRLGGDDWITWTCPAEGCATTVTRRNHVGCAHELARLDSASGEWIAPSEEVRAWAMEKLAELSDRPSAPPPGLDFSSKPNPAQSEATADDHADEIAEPDEKKKPKRGALV